MLPTEGIPPFPSKVTMNSVAVFCFVISANRDVDLFPALSCAQRERTPLFSSSVPGMVKVPSLPALTDAPSSP